MRVLALEPEKPDRLHILDRIRIDRMMSDRPLGALSNGHINGIPLHLFLDQLARRIEGT
jgi:hypothetical protein